jgi:hypothetical protein
MEIGIIEIARILIALVGTGIASYYDIFNKKNIPELFLYAFLGLSFIINIFDYSLVLKFLPLALPLIALLYVLYRIGQIGGADVIVISAIYLTIPIFPFSQEGIFPSILIIISISTVLAFLGVIIKYLPSIFEKTINGKIKFKLTQILESIALIVSFLVIIYMFLVFPYLPIWMVLLFALLFFESIFFILYKEEIKKQMVVWKTKVEPEEVLAVEYLKPELVNKMKLGALITEKQAKEMNKKRIKWPILDLPMFLPYIFIGLIFYLVIGFGNL